MKPPILFNNVSFAYENGRNIFKDMTLGIPSGVVSLIGQNGTGKSTLLLLAGGRIVPQQGRVLINGIDTITLNSDERRNRISSFIFQNMEFEAEENIGDLISIIYKNGFHKEKNPQLLKTIIDIMDLSSLLHKKTGNVSKGEFQRTVIAFSLLYGSPIIFMDEPVFAMENNRKEIVLAYITEFAKQFNITIYYSIHEINLSRKYSDNVLLFTKDGQIICGSTKQLLQQENIEKAYQVPMDMLHQRENLYREYLKKDNMGELKELHTKILE